MRKGAAGFAGLCGGDAAVLLGLRPDFAALGHHCAALSRWFAEAGADHVLAALAGALLWCVAAWLGLGLLAVAGSCLPGGGGRVAAAVCRALLPAMLRRLLAGSAGLGVLLSPALASAQPVVASAPPAAAFAQAGPGIAAARADAPDTGRADPLPPPVPPSVTGPAPGWPTSQAARRRPATARASGTVRVAPGDSLWLLAAARLGPHATDCEIATYWPHWYALNRNVIGTDPSLIVPGQVLRVPAPTTRRSSP